MGARFLRVARNVLRQAPGDACTAGYKALCAEGGVGRTQLLGSSTGVCGHSSKRPKEQNRLSHAESWRSVWGQGDQACSAGSCCSSGRQEVRVGSSGCLRAQTGQPKALPAGQRSLRLPPDRTSMTGFRPQLVHRDPTGSRHVLGRSKGNSIFGTDCRAEGRAGLKLSAPHPWQEV